MDTSRQQAKAKRHSRPKAMAEQIVVALATLLADRFWLPKRNARERAIGTVEPASPDTRFGAFPHKMNLPE